MMRDGGNTLTVSDFLNKVSSHYSDKLALSGHNSGKWSEFSYKEIDKKAQELARFLFSQGLKQDSRVLILAKSKPELAIGFFGIALTGATTVLLDLKLTLEELIYQSQFADADALICFEDETHKTAQKISEQVESLKNKVYTVEEALSIPTTINIDFNLTSIKPDDVAVMAYTSGTVASPKCVMIPWSNLLFQISKLHKALGITEKKPLKFLSILPLHHLLEFTCGLLVPLSHGGQVFYANSILPHEVLSFIKLKKIQEMIVVPLFLKALKKGVDSEINRSSIKRIWFQVSQFISALVPIKSLRRLIFSPIHKKLGGKLRMFVVGASSLEKDVARFFELMGIDVFQGYGLTETSPVISVNRPGQNNHSSVGHTLEEVEIKLLPGTNEIVVRGPLIMKGYYKNDLETQKCIDSDRWFYTGDVGHIDQKGFLSIVGREKELIVLGNGKKVVPTEVEDELKKSEYVLEVCVLGMNSNSGAHKGSEIVTAVVVPDYTKIKTEDSDNFILEDLKKYVQNLSYYKRPSRIIIEKSNLPKTSTQKFKRSVLRNELISKGSVV